VALYFYIYALRHVGVKLVLKWSLWAGVLRTPCFLFWCASLCGCFGALSFLWPSRMLHYVSNRWKCEELIKAMQDAKQYTQCVADYEYDDPLVKLAVFAAKTEFMKKTKELISDELADELSFTTDDDQLVSDEVAVEKYDKLRALHEDFDKSLEPMLKENCPALWETLTNYIY
jgi:hypothetical protein